MSYTAKMSRLYGFHVSDNGARLCAVPHKGEQSPIVVFTTPFDLLSKRHDYLSTPLFAPIPLFDPPTPSTNGTTQDETSLSPLVPEPFFSEAPIPSSSNIVFIHHPGDLRLQPLL